MPRQRLDQVDAMRPLKQAGVPYTFHRYEAQHAFANENNVNSPLPIKYDQAAAETAGQRTVEFFDKHLGVPQPA